MQRFVTLLTLVFVFFAGVGLAQAAKAECIAPNGTKVKPGKTYVDGCNSCVCQRDGSFSCTNTCASCWVPQTNQTYASGATWTDTDGCNTCTCNDGATECTNLLCDCYSLDQTSCGTTLGCMWTEPGCGAEGSFPAQCVPNHACSSDNECVDGMTCQTLWVNPCAGAWYSPYCTFCGSDFATCQ